MEEVQHPRGVADQRDAAAAAAASSAAATSACRRCSSPISPLYLPYISPASPLYLPYISACEGFAAELAQPPGQR